MKYILNKTLLLLFAVLCFTGCKKYPENTLWFKNPTKVLGRNYTKPWTLEYYSVNDYNFTSNSNIEVYKTEGMYLFSGNKNYNRFQCPGILEGSIEFISNKKILFSDIQIMNFILTVQQIQILLIN